MTGMLLVGVGKGRHVWVKVVDLLCANTDVRKVYVRVCVCMCVCERGIKYDSEGAREGEGEKERERERVKRLDWDNESKRGRE